MCLEVVSTKNLGEHLNEVMCDRSRMIAATGHNLVILCNYYAHLPESYAIPNHSQLLLYMITVHG